MTIIRNGLGLSQASLVRRLMLRLVVLVAVFWGVKSTAEMGFGSKLMLTYSLDMWDFNESTLGFFVNYASIVALFAALTHYALALVRAFRSPRLG
jgi:hypothetical protein